MLDYEYIFSKSLHEKLKTRIKGRIYVCVTKQNELRVEIDNFKDINYVFLTDNSFSNLILNGYSTEQAMREVIIDYKRYVLEKTFYK